MSNNSMAGLQELCTEKGGMREDILEEAIPTPIIVNTRQDVLLVIRDLCEKHRIPYDIEIKADEMDVTLLCDNKPARRLGKLHGKITVNIGEWL